MGSFGLYVSEVLVCFCLHSTLFVNPLLSLTLPQERSESPSFLELSPNEKIKLRDLDNHKRTFIAKKKLGDGSFGEVWAAQNATNSSVWWAVKDIFVPEAVDEEIEMLEKVEGIPYVLQLKGSKHNFVATEFYNCGDLFGMYLGGVAPPSTCPIKSTKAIGEKEVAKALYQSLLGLAGMHAENLAHLDIKPENILVHVTVDRRGTADFEFAIGDLGLAARTARDGTMTRESGSCTSGTLDYYSPNRYEIMLDRKNDHGCNGFVEDIWALGVTGLNYCLQDQAFALYRDWGRGQQRKAVSDGLKAIRAHWVKTKTLDFSVANAFDDRIAWQLSQTQWGICSEEFTDAVKMLLVPDPKLRSAVSPLLIEAFKKIAFMPFLKGRQTFKQTHAEWTWGHDVGCPFFHATAEDVQDCQMRVIKKTSDQLEKAKTAMETAQQWTRDVYCERTPNSLGSKQMCKADVPNLTQSDIFTKVQKTLRNFCRLDYCSRSKKRGDCQSTCDKHHGCEGFCTEFRDPDKHSSIAPTQWAIFGGRSGEEKLGDCFDTCYKAVGA
uniref:Protein kinase domain-containing protein n=1 Tax=Chromera velia CCMP2878 TaxID=1169474 RepID=A0A0G4GPU3_9ALVE|eukprot:Cvel_5021.t1-p1 / transcript=Cvel_5021.t1 / gene=Cvel_5021 / organism=Chromera_velia_CCMP2878 / gene_product=Serine/threonine-protein kinase pakH, putative / transcript_product=Serine/threonine-protein kinase pakH, putative / location=Cvel_scaffold228:46615-48645(-) / protein_length=549 / sequence_SO=supercontig / SO=protein_coding / is_pseudo=false